MLFSLVLISVFILIFFYTLGGMSIYGSGEVCLGGLIHYIGSISIISYEWLMIGMLGFCGCIALNYCSHYFGWVKQLLYILISLFLSVMVLLVISGEPMTSLIFWEYLGFISFILILYYSNYDTCYAANVTLISSRVGDVAFFFICALFMKDILQCSLFWVAFLSFFIVASKSAVIPFTSWLLEAMRAPTPVSSLVHSSTLVAGGVWYYVSYGAFPPVPPGGEMGVEMLIFCCFITIILTASCSLHFVDVKKIVALSTSNNIAWCLIYAMFSFYVLCVVQLVTHGLAKCLLFMGLGDNLAGSYSSQGAKLIFGIELNSFLGWVSLITLVMGIAGLPYQGVFFTKHFLVGFSVFNYNYIVCLAVFYSIYLSNVYSFRLICLFFSGLTGYLRNWMSSIFICFSVLTLVSSFFKYFMHSLLVEMSQLGVLFSGFIVFLQLMGALTGWKKYTKYCSDFWWFSDLVGQDWLLNKSYTHWVELIETMELLLMFRAEVSFCNYCIKSISLIMKEIKILGVTIVVISVLIFLVLLFI